MLAPQLVTEEEWDSGIRPALSAGEFPAQGNSLFGSRSAEIVLFLHKMTEDGDPGDSACEP